MRMVYASRLDMHWLLLRYMVKGKAPLYCGHGTCLPPQVLRLEGSSSREVKAANATGQPPVAPGSLSLNQTLEVGPGG